MIVPSNMQLGAQLEPTGVRFLTYTEAASCSLQLLDSAGEASAARPMQAIGAGYFELLVPEAGAGTRYWISTDGSSFPDPCARRLPQGVHGPAEVVAVNYEFRHELPIRPLSQQVLYELHVGTFTEEGTFRAAARRLAALAALGITTIELMPLAAFAGERGWGYDGVAWFAPHAAYGTPDELRELVDTAHGLGLAVLLDVVYNHFGPSGNYLYRAAPSFFSPEHHNAWGRALDFSQPALRQLVLQNVGYWLEEFNFDGLRLDATHAILESESLLAEIATLAHQLQPPRLIIAEDERNLASLVSKVGLDALWADDFHHQVRVTLSGESHGYYAAYAGSAQGVADAINRGWLYSGQRSPLSGEPRGTSAESLTAESLVYCIQNHDQIGNRPLGDRLDVLIGRHAYRAASLLLLFLPMTPLLFMGQEWAASTPFLYFTDHDDELGEQIKLGRSREFAEFQRLSGQAVPDPQALATFRASQLRWSERELPGHVETLELYRAALELRRSDAVLSRGGREGLLARALGEVLFVHRFDAEDRRVLLVNFSSSSVSLAGLVEATGLREPRRLLSTNNDIDAVLPAHGAVVLAGFGNLAGLVGKDA